MSFAIPQFCGYCGQTPTKRVTFVPKTNKETSTIITAVICDKPICLENVRIVLQMQRGFELIEKEQTPLEGRGSQSPER